MDEQTYMILYVGVIIFGIFFLFAKIKHNTILEKDVGKDDSNSDLPIIKQNAVVLSKIEPENPNGVFLVLLILFSKRKIMNEKNLQL